MLRRVKCDCGHQVIADDLAEVVALARSHALDAHNLDMAAELVLIMAEPVDPAADGATR